MKNITGSEEEEVSVKDDGVQMFRRRQSSDTDDGVSIGNGINFNISKD